MASLIPFTLDLTAHETTRLAAVLDALGPHWYPTEIYLDEAQAHRMLYAHLDADQQATYDVLLTAGELPEIPEADLWFAETPHELDQAKQLCAGCPIRVSCLAGALHRREPWGVRGGEILHRGTIVTHQPTRRRPRTTIMNRSRSHRRQAVEHRAVARIARISETRFHCSPTVSRWITRSAAIGERSSSSTEARAKASAGVVG